MELRDPSTYDKMNYDELVEELRRLDEIRMALLARAKKVNAALDKVIALEEAKKKVANLSDAQKAALAQVLQPSGIPSGEKMGTPGA